MDFFGELMAYEQGSLELLITWGAASFLAGVLAGTYMERTKDK
jgi:hypothetical protein